MKLSKEQTFLVCAHAICDLRTLNRYLSGGRVHRSTAERIERAARELGLTLSIREAV